MRFLVIVVSAAMLALPAVSSAMTSAVPTAKSSLDYSAKKKTKMARKRMHKKKKAKVEYMRAVPSTPPAKGH